jgi:putative SOS response-associated peptidase YedK
MCNRVRPASRTLLKSTFGNIIIIDEGVEKSVDEIEEAPELLLGYEHPRLPVMTSLHPQRFEYMEWSYVSSRMCNDPDLLKKLGPMLHARTEDIFRKPMFAESIRQRRCIIPLEGFYDYQHCQDEGKTIKQPYYISKTNGLMFAAGIWDECNGIKRFATLTTDTNPLLTHIANHTLRQKLIIDEDKWEQWFSPLTDAALEAMFHIYPDTDMKAELYDMPKPKPRAKKAKEEKPPTPPAQPSLF